MTPGTPHPPELGTCDWCGEATDDLDRVDGTLICSECYCDQFHFTCSWCQEHGDVKDQHRLLVVFEPVAMGIDLAAPGIYRIKSFPYYVDGMLDAWFLSDRLELIARWIPNVRFPDYPCGHLCASCQAKVAA